MAVIDDLAWASALSLGTWTVVFEPDGFNGSHLTAEVSRGTEAVSVLRHDDALAAAERVTVTPDSPLGQHVRTWLTESRRANWSLNDHSGRHRMTETERRRAFDFGWLARALGAALQPAAVD
jgi:hypothetical protein